MINWENKFSVNVSKFDEEHKFFILILNKIFSCRQESYNHAKISQVLNEMTLYAISHFKSEERYMLKLDYPDYQQHKEEHKHFLMTTVNFCKRVMNGNRNMKIIEDMCEFLQEWLTFHIQGTDKKYTDHFNMNGVI